MTIVIRGVNDLASKFPKLAGEWHPSKNFPRTPQDTYAGSEIRIFWVCSKNPNHEWDSILYSRVRGTGCPFCSNKRVLRGDNDLATTHPEIAKLWHPTKNVGISPNEMNSGSQKLIWWQCIEVKDHVWRAPPVRQKLGGRCPDCSPLVAQSGKTDLATTHPEIAKEWDFEKNGNLTPQFVKAGSNKSVWWACGKSAHSWKGVVANRARLGRGCPFCANQRILKGYNDLATTHPKIAETWSQKNYPVLNLDVMAGSGKRYWWSCDQGHDFLMAVFRRRQGSECNICAGKVVAAGVNDLASTNPQLLGEWNLERNLPLRPTDVTISSNKKVWWTCAKNKLHIWQSSPNNRKRNGCPVCIGYLILPGVNDLPTLYPELFSEWAFDLNTNLSPTTVPTRSNLKIWWRCPNDSQHTWQAAIGNRSRRGDGCPFCSNQALLMGYNDLASKFPEISEEWDRVKNSPLTPNEVLFGTDQSVWWKCLVDNRHVWKAQVSKRTAGGTGCAVCANLVIIDGVNDLATLAPELAQFWHPTKNLPLKPMEVGAGSHTRAWWICDEVEAHVWKAPIVARMVGTGCPKCSNGGYDQTSPGYLYLLRKENMGLQQFGISNVPEKRVAVHKKNGWEVLDVIGPADGWWILQTETALKGFFRAEKLLLPMDYEDKFDGYSESWDSTEVQFNMVEEMLSALRDFEWSGETL